MDEWNTRAERRKGKVPFTSKYGSGPHHICLLVLDLDLRLSLFSSINNIYPMHIPLFRREYCDRFPARFSCSCFP